MTRQHSLPPSPGRGPGPLRSPAKPPSTTPPPSPSPELPPRELAALASACLLIDDAKLYGLIEGGPDSSTRRG
jgi:hypothetical protein